MIVWPVIIAAIIAEQSIRDYETTIRPGGACRCRGRVRSRRVTLWLTTLTNLVGELSIEAAVVIFRRVHQRKESSRRGQLYVCYLLAGKTRIRFSSITTR